MRISLQLNDLLHTPPVYSTSLSSAFALVHSDTNNPHFTHISFIIIIIIIITTTTTIIIVVVVDY